MANHYMQIALQKTFAEELRTQCAALSGAGSGNQVSMTNANFATAMINTGKIEHGAVAQYLKAASAKLSNTSGGMRIFFVANVTYGDINGILIHTDNSAFYHEMINDGNAVPITAAMFAAVSGLSQT